MKDGLVGIQKVDVSDCGTSIKKKCGDTALMRLNSDNKINLNYKINVRVKSEVQNDAVMMIGLVNSENWGESIGYDHFNGQIYDNRHDIKRVNKLENKGSILKIENKIIRKTNDNKKIFKMSCTINEEEKGTLYYQDVQPMVPYLMFSAAVEVDVEVISKILIIF